MVLGTLRTRLVALIAAIMVAMAMTFIAGPVPSAATNQTSKQSQKSNSGKQQKSQKCQQKGSGHQKCSQKSKQNIKRR